MVIENGPLHMLERLRSNQDYQLAVIENGPLQNDSGQKRGKTRQSQERQEENRSTAPGRDVGHLTTRTPPRTAEQRQRKGKETKDWRKTSREEGQAVVTEDATTLLQRSSSGD